MDIEITPSKLCGSIEAISSKSFAHRLLCASLLSEGETNIALNSFSDDIMATVNCINTLGAKVIAQSNCISIYSDRTYTNKAILNAAESGTTARFMLPICASLCDSYEIDGFGRLPKRPFSPICDAMRKNGASLNGDFLPIVGKGRIKGGIYELSGNVSTQFISGLLFALPTLEADSEIRITTQLEGFPYIEMTLEVLRQFSVDVSYINNTFFIRGKQRFITPKNISCEGDWSNSAFFIAANSIGSNIEIFGLNYSSLQGDRKILNLVQSISDTDACDIPDLVPILAVLYSVSEKDVTIYNAARLRLKESDRLFTTTAMLKSLGADIEEKSDSIIIHGRASLDGGETESYGDHRIAMAAAIASTVCKNKVIIRNAQAVNKSYPEFFDIFKTLGGRINVI